MVIATGYIAVATSDEPADVRRSARSSARSPLLRARRHVGDGGRARCSRAACRRCPSSTREDRFVGVFGEREFIAALFPAYFEQLGSPASSRIRSTTRSSARAACRAEPVGEHMTTDHVEVGADFSDAEVAEIFLHHRVLIVPSSTTGGCSASSRAATSSARSPSASASSLT